MQSIPGQAGGALESLRFPFVQNFQEGFINHVAAVGVFQPDALPPVLRINNPQPFYPQTAKTIQLAAQRLDVAILIEFKDTGQGMPEELRRRAFTSLLGTTKQRGTGLGLAIVGRVIETHRGKVKISSRPGIGTTFSITLPAR